MNRLNHGNEGRMRAYVVARHVASGLIECFPVYGDSSGSGSVME
jgi:hypothetical protein